MTTRKVFALATLQPTENLVWAFECREQYGLALRLLREYRMPHFAYHTRNALGEPVAVTVWDLSDEVWLELSEGPNDATEVLNWIEAHDMKGSQS